MSFGCREPRHGTREFRGLAGFFHYFFRSSGFVYFVVFFRLMSGFGGCGFSGGRCRCRCYRSCGGGCGVAGDGYQAECGSQDQCGQFFHGGFPFRGALENNSVSFSWLPLWGQYRALSVMKCSAV